MLLRYVEERILLSSGFFVGGVIYLIGVVSLHKYTLLFACAATGFFSGATNPLVITLGYRGHPEAPGKVSMLLFIAVTIGGIVVPWAMGMVTGLIGLHGAIIANGSLLLIAGAISLKLPRRNSKRHA